MLTKLIIATSVNEVQINKLLAVFEGLVKKYRKTQLRGTFNDMEQTPFKIIKNLAEEARKIRGIPIYPQIYYTGYEDYYTGVDTTLWAVCQGLARREPARIVNTRDDLVSDIYE